MSNGQLPIRRIEIKHDDFAELQKDAWTQTFVPVRLEVDGKPYEAKIAYRGGHTLNYSKKSYEIRFEEGLVLHWNAEYDDPSMIRNALSFHFFNEIGVSAPRTRPILLEWNGEPHGVYLEIEAVNSRFFNKRGLGCRSLIYAVNDNANFDLFESETKKRKSSLSEGYEIVIGESRAKQRIVSFVRNVNTLRGTKLSAYLKQRLDTNQYLLWLAGAVLTGNYDGFEQNYALYEEKQAGKYRILPWDYEGTWGRNCYGKQVSSDLVRINGYNRLTARLLSFTVWRKQYCALLRELLDTHFTIEKLSPVIDRMHRRVSDAIRLDYTRNHSYQLFLSEPALIRNYIKERRATILRDLKLLENGKRKQTAGPSETTGSLLTVKI
ncbi:CotH kinase family protein [Paenibacillus beijingensis]|uniref:Spore coat protein CotH n=1 Tax=Paenibacillus beijingensis TaxID=1126833 RepID=A0A0D5NFG7_9BACL|nr:CotH kinase family protein [Paenibacillus beijingensis]AJY73643.1 spore coat protein CotH [Paenibacillus beijingensis]